MAEKISVLHILHELHPSGAEMMLKNAYPYWKDTCEGTVMATGKMTGPFADALQKTGYKIAYVPTNGAGKDAKIRHLQEFWRYMKKHRYDVVHIHRESLSFEYALIAKMTGSSHIVRTVHSTFAHTGIQQKIKSATRWMMKHWLHVQFIAISDGVAANEQKVFGNSCDEVIYNWCNNQKFTFVSAEEKLAWKRAGQKEMEQKSVGQKEMEQKIAGQKETEQSRATGMEDKLVLITVGNCSTVKNHTVLLAALAKCRQRERICYLHVGYAKDKTEEEETLAEQLGLQKQVHFLGSTDPMPYLRQADVFLMTSIYEGLSIATLEAIFTGMPVLLAEAPGLTEFKDKGLCGVDYFISTPEELAEKLDSYVKLYDEGRLVPRIEQRQRAEELYDCGRQTERYAQVYQRLVWG